MDLLAFVCWSAPQFVDVHLMTDHVTSTTGSTEKLSCSAVGLPTPQLVWYRDGVTLSDADVDEDLAMVDGTDSDHVTSRPLILRHLAPADSAQYRCVAFNRVGNVSFTYHLHVVGQ